MANLFGNQVILEAFDGAIIFQDVPLQLPLARIVFSALDPSMAPGYPAEIGSIAVTPTIIGPYQKIGVLDTDWVPLGGAPTSVNTTLCRVAVAVTAVAPPAVNSVTFLVTNLDGSPVTAPKRLILMLYEGSGEGDNNLAGTAVWTGATTGTLASGVGTNRAVGVTNAAGVLVLTTANPVIPGSPFVYTTSASSGVPTGVGTSALFVVAEAAEGQVYT